jgi:hypothetical protein
MSSVQETPMKFLVLTTIDTVLEKENPFAYESFLKSCEVYEIPLYIVHCNSKDGMTKWASLKQYCEPLDPKTIILYVDARQSIFLRPLKELYEFYKKQMVKRNGNAFMYFATEYTSPNSLMNAVLQLGGSFSDYKDKIINTNVFMMSVGILQDIEFEKKKCSWSDEHKSIVQYLKTHPEVDIILDDNRRILNYPRMRIDVGANMSMNANTLYYRNEKKEKVYKPYILHRDSMGSLSKITNQFDSLKAENKVEKKNVFDKIKGIFTN